MNPILSANLQKMKLEPERWCFGDDENVNHFKHFLS